jgi:uncharacterized membrane protein
MRRADRRARKGSPLNLPSAFQLFKPSKDLVLKNKWVFGPLYIAPLLFTIHAWVWTPSVNSQSGRSWWWDYSWFGSGFSSSSIPAYLWYSLIGFSVLWLLFVLVAGTILQIMSQRAQLEVAQHKGTVSFSELWPTVKELGWRMLGLYLLVGLYILVGLILLIVPGLIMLRRYFLAPYVMLDTKCSIKEAMDKSAAMSKPMPRAIWGIIGVTILISLINIVPLIGWLIAFVLGSLYSVAPALRYEQLKKLA